MKDMLAEFAETALAPATDTIAASSSSAQQLEKLGEVIQKELETRRAEVVARNAALAAAEAERVAVEKAKAKAIAGAGAGAGAGERRTAPGIAGPGHGTGIAEAVNAHPSERPAARQEQLEKMVKALVARLEKVRQFLLQEHRHFVVNLRLFFYSPTRKLRRRTSCLTSMCGSSTSSRRTTRKPRYLLWTPA